MAELSTEVMDRLKKKMREEILAELLASGGISYDRVAQELLYYIPDDFKAIYVRVFHEAMSATDGNINQRGVNGAETAALGRAPGKAAGKAPKKRGTFFITDERVLEVKEKADKRLRALARDMRYQLEEVRSTQIGEVKSARAMSRRQELDSEIKAHNNGALRPTCGKCHKFVSIEYQFCPSCGHALGN